MTDLGRLRAQVLAMRDETHAAYQRQDPSPEGVLGLAVATRTLNRVLNLIDENVQTAARDAVWGCRTYVANNRTYCAECNSQLPSHGHAKGCAADPGDGRL